MRIHATGPWAHWWRAWYRMLRLGGGPLTRLAERPGFGNIVVLDVPGRRSGRPRRVPVGLLRVDGELYIGHPNGDTAWTLNVRDAPSLSLHSAWLADTRFRAAVLPPGAERDAVVRATFRQHPFPGNVLYRLAGRHVSSFGVFFRLELPHNAPGGDR